MPYIPHPDKPAGVQEIELHMREMMSFQKFNRWDMGRLDWWLDNRPDQIHNATVGLRGHFEDQGHIPQELTQIDEAFDELYRCQLSNCWSLMDLNKWLETYPDIIFAATLRLENMLEEKFPPLEPSIYAVGEHFGNVHAHHYQTV